MLHSSVLASSFLLLSSSLHLLLLHSLATNQGGSLWNNRQSRIICMLMQHRASRPLVALNRRHIRDTLAKAKLQCLWGRQGTASASNCTGNCHKFRCEEIWYGRSPVEIPWTSRRCWLLNFLKVELKWMENIWITFTLYSGTFMWRSTHYININI